jgi:hypothetical protein
MQGLNFQEYIEKEILVLFQAFIFHSQEFSEGCLCVVFLRLMPEGFGIALTIA